MENASVNRMHAILVSRACMINTGDWAEIYDGKICVWSFWASWEMQSFVRAVVTKQVCTVETAVYACCCVCVSVGERAERECLNYMNVGVSPLSAQFCLYTHICTLIHTCMYTHHCESQHKALKLTCLNQQWVWLGNTLHMNCCVVQFHWAKSPQIRNRYVSSARVDLLHSTR